MSALEGRYRGLLRAYPPDYRSAYGEEIIGTLMEVSEPGRERPAVREMAALITGGLTARVRTATGNAVPWWVDGLHLGVLMVVLVNLISYPGGNHYPWWLAGSALLVLARHPRPPGRAASRPGLVRRWQDLAAHPSPAAQRPLDHLPHSPGSQGVRVPTRGRHRHRGQHGRADHHPRLCPTPLTPLDPLTALRPHGPTP